MYPVLLGLDHIIRGSSLLNPADEDHLHSHQCKWCEPAVTFVMCCVVLCLSLASKFQVAEPTAARPISLEML